MINLSKVKARAYELKLDVHGEYVAKAAGSNDFSNSELNQFHQEKENNEKLAEGADPLLVKEALDKDS